MKTYCSHCHNETIWGKEIYFSFGKGILCRDCYEQYDLEIKFIEQDFNVGRGFKDEQQKN